MFCYTTFVKQNIVTLEGDYLLDLISKKELLAQTGISYGQLYRWKRARLIPEEWFLKQSAFTGQETFFPREQVLRRIQAIQMCIRDRRCDHSSGVEHVRPPDRGREHLPRP